MVLMSLPSLFRGLTDDPLPVTSGATNPRWCELFELADVLWKGVLGEGFRSSVEFEGWNSLRLASFRSSWAAKKREVNVTLGFDTLVGIVAFSYENFASGCSYPPLVGWDIRLQVLCSGVSIERVLPVFLVSHPGFWPDAGALGPVAAKGLRLQKDWLAGCADHGVADLQTTATRSFTVAKLPRNLQTSEKYPRWHQSHPKCRGTLKQPPCFVVAAVDNFSARARSKDTVCLPHEQVESRALPPDPAEEIFKARHYRRAYLLATANPLLTPFPPSQLFSRRQLVTLRQIQTGTILTPYLLQRFRQHSSSHREKGSCAATTNLPGACALCHRNADLEHLPWDCPLYSEPRTRTLATIQ
ncbi:hypothetical protein ISCGN_018243 [Ixodes scapularis]